MSTSPFVNNEKVLRIRFCANVKQEKELLAVRKRLEVAYASFFFDYLKREIEVRGQLAKFQAVLRRLFAKIPMTVAEIDSYDAGSDPAYKAEMEALHVRDQELEESRLVTSLSTWTSMGMGFSGIPVQDLMAIAGEYRRLERVLIKRFHPDVLDSLACRPEVRERIAEIMKEHLSTRSESLNEKILMASGMWDGWMDFERLEALRGELEEALGESLAAFVDRLDEDEGRRTPEAVAEMLRTAIGRHELRIDGLKKDVKTLTAVLELKEEKSRDLDGLLDGLARELEATRTVALQLASDGSTSGKETES